MHGCWRCRATFRTGVGGGAEGNDHNRIPCASLRFLPRFSTRGRTNRRSREFSGFSDASANPKSCLSRSTDIDNDNHPLTLMRMIPRTRKLLESIAGVGTSLSRGLLFRIANSSAWGASPWMHIKCRAARVIYIYIYM